MCVCVEVALELFLQHHLQALDSVILIDDSGHGENSTVRHWIEQHALEYRVEVFLQKISRPCLQELPDRNLMLNVAYELNVSHAVSLDLDEWASWDAMQPGSAPQGSIHRNRFRHELALLGSASAGPNQSPPGWSSERLEMWNSWKTHRVRSAGSPYSFLAELCFAQALMPEGSLPPPALSFAGFRAGVCSMHVYRFNTNCVNMAWRRERRVLGVVSPILGTKIIHLRFLSDSQRILKGAWYEIRGLYFAIVYSVLAKQAESVGHALNTQYVRLESTWQRKANDAIGGVFRHGDNAVLVPLDTDAWLGPNFHTHALPLLLPLKQQALMEVLELRDKLLQALPSFESTALWKDCRYLNKVQWDQVDRSALFRREPLLELPML